MTKAYRVLAGVALALGLAAAAVASEAAGAISMTGCILGSHGAEFEKCVRKCAGGEGVKLGTEATITGTPDASTHTLKVEAIARVEKKS